MRLLLLVLALSSSASAELLGTLSGAIKGVGDGRVATVACCGASKIGASTVLSAAATKSVEVMPAEQFLPAAWAPEEADDELF